MITKSRLAIELSKLRSFENPKIKAEQYMTDSENAAEILWLAYMKGDLEDKTVADFGCGTGILGNGALLLGAKKVFFIDYDENALKICKENVGKTKKAEFILQDIDKFDKKTDVVVENPPFGTKIKHADKEFLERAFKTADVVYSFHKLITREFIEKFADKNGFKVTDLIKINLPIKSSYKFHKSRIKRIEVGCWRFEKK